ncbi:nuclear receptor coactivator 2 isoform X2 [Onthophagus taurus]|uniref:nuclear receptor coactivator 2 isoform X2 n=1 Tax=Onthophagus taurus TaxID=166361 RepID=UPI000C1FDEDF|nr:nuclear receptor coactivator 2 isoform X2 [Onthophagus taurus]
MLEHTAMYFTPICEEDTSSFPDFYTRLGPCELQDPVWAKMSALASGAKKRKKSETKPQAQINKCNNEKRRREQENIYIEELAELISANFADMSSLSVKPDKCAILQETVNQIRSIKQRESASRSTDPVQQGEVSSSRPNILSTDVYGHLLLEALDGFLFVVNGEGKVEHVTKNVQKFIKFTDKEILGETIYNFIHPGDHTSFVSSLPMSIGWSSETSTKSRSFSCRLLIKADDQDDVLSKDKSSQQSQQQQQRDRYEVMSISSTQLTQDSTGSEDDPSDGGPCLLCVASRITHRDRAAIFTIEQFTTKLDTSGKIIGIDTSGVNAYTQFLNKDLMGRILQDLCAQQDLRKLTQHLRDTLSAGQGTSVTYRLKLSQDNYVNVQTKSKLFKAGPHSSEADFIMATHAIIGDNEQTRPNDPGGGGNNNNNSFGGPLMTSVVNGTSRNGSSSAYLTTSMTSSSGNPPMLTPFVLDEYNFDLQTVWGDISLPDTRNECRQSLTPASTPSSRPPSAPAYSPGGGGATVQSPMSQYVVTQQQSPAPNPPTPAAYSTFNYSPVGESFPMDEQKETKVILFEDNPSPMVVVGGGDSGKLRDLLTKPPNSVESSDSDNKNGRSNKNTHKILKDLLNQKDEDDNENKGSPKVNSLGRANSIAGPSDNKPNTSGNYMLRELLSETSDDDDRDVRAGLKPQSELLQQLLKDEQPKSEPQSQEDSLLKSLGFPSPTSGEGRGVKRPHEERDQKRNSSDGVSSTGTTELCKKNQMLAKLLATQPNPQPIPPVPSSIITATPQDTLNKTGRVVPTNAMKQQTSPHQNPNAMIVAAAAARGSQRMAVRQPTTGYLNQILSPDNSGMQRSQNGPFNAVTTAVVGPDGVQWEQTSGSDPYLSQLLDQVIDIVQQDSSNDILTLLDAAPQQNNTNGYQQHEVMAINKIQESLMQIEAMNSPTSPNIALTVAPPTYPSSVLTTQNANQQQPGFQPPRPGYQRAPVQRPTRPAAPQFPVSGGGLINKQLPMHQKLPMHTSQQQQQQFDREKVRLLTQQQQQHLVIPSNATVEMKPGMQNIDSLLNNTVAPNVSLQRSNSVTDSQLSPPYRGQITQQRQRQGAFPPQSTVGNYQQHNAARLSPHPPFTQQLSPRQVYPPGSNQNINPNWQQNRLTLQQQQNPMLNAQLTGNFVSGPSTRGGFPVQHSQQQQQQAMGGSPGAAASTRHSPYSADTFPPGSPNASFNQNQYLRLQRANSAPTATTQLSGGLGSPRPYGREHPPHSSYPPIPQSPHHTMIYQQDSQYCYDQTGLQLPYNGADRGRVPTHLQPGVSASGGTTSEYVRQELRNVVGARAQAQPSNTRPQGQILTQNVTQDLDLGGLNYDLPTTGASESPKLWAAMGSDMGSMSPQPATSRTTMEEGPRQGDHNNSRSSLLQKLLSE